MGITMRHADDVGIYHNKQNNNNVGRLRIDFKSRYTIQILKEIIKTTL